MTDPFAMGRSGGLPGTATSPALPSTSAITAPTPTLMAESAVRCSGRARRSSCAPETQTPCSAGASSSTTAASWALIAPSSETKARRSRHSLSDRLTLSLITSGLVSGITPMSVRRQSGQAIPDTVSWRRDGDGAATPRAACSSSNDDDADTTDRQPSPRDEPLHHPSDKEPGHE